MKTSPCFARIAALLTTLLFLLTGAELRAAEKPASIAQEKELTEAAEKLVQEAKLADARALGLFLHDKPAEAEQEWRKATKTFQMALGAEHPDTLSRRFNVAIALSAQGKHAEAEKEHRAILGISLRILGPEHQETWRSRNTLAAVLGAQGKHAEAEAEYRALLAVIPPAADAEHRGEFIICFDLAVCLEKQDKRVEALQFGRRSLAGWLKFLGKDNLGTQEAQKLVDRLSAPAGKP